MYFNEDEDKKINAEENDEQKENDIVENGDEKAENEEIENVETETNNDAVFSDSIQSEKSQKKHSTLTAPAIAILLACVLIFSAVVGYGGWRLYEQVINGQTSSSDNITDTEKTNNTTKPVETTQSTTSIKPSGEVDLNSVYINPESTKTSDTSTEITNMISDCYSSCVVINMFRNGAKVGAGSGVTYTTNGYIMTNYHVASNTDLSGLDLEVVFPNGETYAAKYVCGDVETDIAVIKIEKNDCHPCTIGNSTTTKLGETIYCIGNPNGNGLTVTDGIISSTSRFASISAQNVTIQLKGLFLISAPVNAGNSGGGLFNAKGELIGIVNSKSYYDAGGNVMEGTATAIPIAKALDCINTLSQNNGYIPGRAKVGTIVSVGGVSISNGWTSTAYTVVTGIQKGSSAEIAGIQVNDVIVAIQGENLITFAREHNLQNDYDALHYILMGYSVGDKVTLTILRPTEKNEFGRVSYETIELELTFVDFNYSIIK